MLYVEKLKAADLFNAFPTVSESRVSDGSVRNRKNPQAMLSGCRTDGHWRESCL
jgi:hypothetical protein